MEEKKKCKICGMKTLSVYEYDDEYGDEKSVPCCEPCYGKYGDKFIDRALDNGDYGKNKVVLFR